MQQAELLVVYKDGDEEIVNGLKRRVETSDDLPERIIGTEDGTVRLMKLSEKKWNIHVSRGDIEHLAKKFLFVGNIGGIVAPTPIFDKYGIKYGISDNRMVLSVDENHQWKPGEEEQFIGELNKINENSKQNDAEFKNANSDLSGNVLLASGLIFPPLAIAGASIKYKANKKRKEHMREQLLIYGLNKIYYDELDKFMKA